MRTRLVAVLLSTALLVASPLAASSGPIESSAFSPLTRLVEVVADGWSNLLGKYSSITDSKSGSAIDPNSSITEYGPGLDPNGAPTDGQEDDPSADS